MSFSALEDNEDIRCSICLMPWWDPVELVPCKHVYCKACVASLPTCPDCRAAIRDRQAPNRILLNMSKAAKLKCDGCPWEGTNEQSRSHRCGATGATAGASPTSVDHRGRLTRFYQFYQPDKLAMVEEILARYRGREAELFQTLIGKYGPEPSASATIPPPPPARPRAQTTVTGPSVSPLVAMAPPPPPPPSSTPGGDSDCRARVVRYYERYAPEKLPLVDEVLKTWAGREPELRNALEMKYGPDPGSLPPTASRPHSHSVVAPRPPVPGVAGGSGAFYPPGALAPSQSAPGYYAPPVAPSYPPMSYGAHAQSGYYPPPTPGGDTSSLALSYSSSIYAPPGVPRVAPQVSSTDPHAPVLKKFSMPVFSPH